MTGDEYLQRLLRQQAMTTATLDSMRSTRETIEQKLRGVYGSGARIYYAGSYAKGTMISAYHDLDIVLYFPSTTTDTLKSLYWGVHNTLASAGLKVQQKNVAIRLPYRNGFYVDVVPGRAQDSTFYNASLYKSETDTWFQTSIKAHIDAVKNSGVRDVIKLVKLWNVRHNLHVRSIAMELLTIRALTGYSGGGLDNRLLHVLTFIRDNIASIRLVDPANSNNIISDLIPAGTKSTIRNQAASSLTQRMWRHIVW